MADRRFDPNAGFVHGTLQPSLDRAEQDGAQSTPALQRDPIDQVTCRAGDNSCATAHASTINRATALQPGRAKHSLLQLQRQYGNRYVERVLSLAREGGAEHDHVSPEVERAIQQDRSGGHPLDGTVRLQMESAMGADFSAVRVHTGDTSDGLNRALEARAFTTGHDIFFRQGAYQPGSSTGRELLAHELTHVVQQTGSAVQRQMEVSNPGDPHEVEAERMAQAVMQRESQAPIGIDGHDKDKDKHAVPAMGCCSGDEAQRQPEAVKDEDERKKHAMRNVEAQVSRQKDDEEAG